MPNHESIPEVKLKTRSSWLLLLFSLLLEEMGSCETSTSQRYSVLNKCVLVYEWTQLICLWLVLREPVSCTFLWLTTESDPLLLCSCLILPGGVVPNLALLGKGACGALTASLGTTGGLVPGKKRKKDRGYFCTKEGSRGASCDAPPSPVSGVRTEQLTSTKLEDKEKKISIELMLQYKNSSSESAECFWFVLLILWIQKVWCQISVQIGAFTAKINPLNEGVAHGKSNRPQNVVNGNVGNHFFAVLLYVQIKCKNMIALHI